MRDMVASLGVFLPHQTSINTSTYQNLKTILSVGPYRHLNDKQRGRSLTYD